jgi:hypothetical protein
MILMVKQYDGEGSEERTASWRGLSSTLLTWLVGLVGIRGDSTLPSEP